jgi:hypothetical protein
MATERVSCCILFVRQGVSIWCLHAWTFLLYYYLISSLPTLACSRDGLDSDKTCFLSFDVVCDTLFRLTKSPNAVYEAV